MKERIYSLSFKKYLGLGSSFLDFGRMKAVSITQRALIMKGTTDRQYLLILKRMSEYLLQAKDKSYCEEYWLLLMLRLW